MAKALGGLPAIDEALRRGEISYSKVRAMTRVATAANEAELLVMARCATGAQLEKICRLKRRVDALTDECEVECRRYVVERPTEDGMVSIQLRLLPDEAARVMKALEVMGGGNRADGAVALAETALGGHLAGGGGSVRPPVEVVVHVQASDLEGRTELGDGISAGVSRRLLCDAGVVPMLEDEQGRTIDVGRKTRTIPAALRRALEARDGGCRFPGCTNRLFTDAHHLEHWLDGGETSLDNTLLVCRHGPGERSGLGWRAGRLRSVCRGAGVGLGGSSGDGTGLALAEGMAKKRERISPRGDTRFVRRDERGRIIESDDAGRSLSSDRRQKAKKAVKAGEGDRGDRARNRK